MDSKLYGKTLAILAITLLSVENAFPCDDETGLDKLQPGTVINLIDRIDASACKPNEDSGRWMTYVKGSGDCGGSFLSQMGTMLIHRYTNISFHPRTDAQGKENSQDLAGIILNGTCTVKSITISMGSPDILLEGKDCPIDQISMGRQYLDVMSRGLFNTSPSLGSLKYNLGKKFQIIPKCDDTSASVSTNVKTKPLNQEIKTDDKLIDLKKSVNAK